MRKLCIGALSFSAAVFLSCYLIPVKYLPLPAVFFISAALIRLFIIRKKQQKIKNSQKAVIISAVFLSVGFSCFFIKYMSSLRPIEKLQGQTLFISGELLDYPHAGEHSQSIEVKILNPELPRVKAVFYIYNADELELLPGDRLEFNAKLRSSATKYGQRYYASNARGIFALGTIKSEINIALNSPSCKALPAKINHTVAKLADSIFSSDTAPFIKSLIIGDRRDFNADISLKSSMQRAGLMHIVAISGMHIAYLVGFLRLLMGKSRKSSVICIASVWLFVLISGAPPSALRAGLMQTVLLMAPVFKRENDTASSLSFALAVLLFINPYAAANVGLQLSFAAMAGLFFLGDKLNKYLLSPIKNKKAKKWLSMPIASAASSVSVMVFTLPLTAVHFGYVSLYSILSNILIFWAVSFCFCGGILCCFLGIFFKAPAVLFANLVSWIIRYIVFVAGFISKLPLAAVYMDSLYGKIWLISSYVLFIIVFFSKLKPTAKLLLPSALSVFILVFGYGIQAYTYKAADGVICVHDIGQGQCLSIISGDKTVLYDCGGTGKLQNAGVTAGSYLNARGRNHIDLLILSHMENDHVNGVLNLMEYCDIDEIIIPIYDYSDNSFYENIVSACNKRNIYIHQLNTDKNLSFNGLNLTIYKAKNAAAINDSSIKLLASVGDYDMLATGDSSMKSELDFISSHKLPEIELLIAGHHGSKYSGSEELIESCGADTVIISCGYNSYGHPSPELIDRYEKYDYNILRTDLDSSVEIRIG